MVCETIMFFINIYIYTNTTINEYDLGHFRHTASSGFTFSRRRGVISLVVQFFNQLERLNLPVQDCSVEDIPWDRYTVYIIIYLLLLDFLWYINVYRYIDNGRYTSAMDPMGMDLLNGRLLRFLV